MKRMSDMRPCTAERSHAIGKPLDIAVLMLGSLASMGGYQVFTYNLLHRLHGHGHAVTLYISHEELRARRDLYASMPFAVCPLLPRVATLLHYCPWVARTHLRMIQNCKRHDVWQVIGAYPAGFLGGGLSGRVPLMLRAHGDDVQVEPELNYGLRLDKTLEPRIRQAVGAMDTVVALTPTMRQCYRDLGVDDNRIVEIPNGFDVERFSRLVDRNAIRQQYGVASGNRFLLTVGRMHKKKNYEIIPEIARRLKDAGLSFAWLVVGKGCEAIETKSRELGLGDAVRAVEEIGVGGGSGASGTCREVPAMELVQLYQAADVFVFPSKLETFGRVLVEAMAAGTPVVTTNAPGCCDVAHDRQNALVCDPDDAVAFASAVQTVLSDETVRESLVDGGLRSAKACDFEDITRRYEAEYQKLLHRPS